MTAAALWTIAVFGVGLGLGVWAAWAFFEARLQRAHFRDVAEGDRRVVRAMREMAEK